MRPEMPNATTLAAEFFNNVRRDVFMAFLPGALALCAFDALVLSIWRRPWNVNAAYALPFQTQTARPSRGLSGTNVALPARRFEAADGLRQYLLRQPQHHTREKDREGDCGE